MFSWSFHLASLRSIGRSNRFQENSSIARSNGKPFFQRSIERSLLDFRFPRHQPDPQRDGRTAAPRPPDSDGQDRIVGVGGEDDLPVPDSANQFGNASNFMG